MQKLTENYLAKMKKSRIIHQNVGQFICIVSVFVILGVFLYLRLTGITLAGEAFCGKEEHIHKDECYELPETCEMEEHIHDENCYSDQTADLENAEIWEAGLKGIEENALEAERLLAVAQSQLGTMESTLNFSVDTEGTRRGITRYGQWYGNPYGDWSGMFLCFCLHYAGITDEMVPYNAGVESMRLEWEAAGFFHEDGETDLGDILFLDTDLDSVAERVGVISEIQENTYRVILGDYEDAVAEIEIGRNDAQILSIGSIAKVFVSNISEEDRQRIENVNARIAALPTAEEIAEKQEQLSEESEEYQIWYEELKLNVLTTYAYYEDLPENLRQQVTDEAWLEEFSWLWENSFMSNEPKSSYGIHQVNTYSNAVETIVYGGSVQEKLGTKMSFKYWTAIRIEKGAEGLYVEEVCKEEISKLNFRAETSGGFILLLYQEGDDIKEGQKVWTSDNTFYKTTSAYTANSKGTVTFTEQKNNDLTEVEAVPTKDMIKIDLYNYGSNINDKWKADKKYPGFQAGNGTTSISSITQWSMNFGDIIKAEKGETVGNKGGKINQLNDVDSANRPISGAMNKVLINGYPALEDGTSLDYLFSDGTYATKVNKANIDGLFQYDGNTGNYYYNSRQNSAQFNPENDTFQLYKELLTTNFLMYPFGNFMPFTDMKSQTTQVTQIDREWFETVATSAMQKYYNGKGDEYQTLSQVLTQFVKGMDGIKTNWNYQTAMEQYFTLSGLPLPPDDPEGSNQAYLSQLYSIDYDEVTDFFFGMSMQVNFIQAKDGTIEENKPMKYHFKGDDDVWVYIDGVLFLDLSGIHRHVGGTIDFENGVVKYYALDTSTGEITNEPYQVDTFADILGSTNGLNDKGTFEDYSMHTMDFYYIERGSGSGVCEIEFNFPMLKQNGITVTKKLEGIETSVLGNPNFYFQCYKEDGKELMIGPGVSYSVLDENGNTIENRTTDENGVFCIKADQSADFGDIFNENEGKYFVRELLDPSVYNQYGTITVDGKATTTDELDVIVGQTTFKGVDSPLKDISDGSTSFLFRNHVDINKIGCLELSKKVTGAVDDSAKEQEFTFIVKFDGELIPEGTVYWVTDVSEQREEKTVVEKGKVVLKHGQTARFENVLAGTKVFVAEEKVSAGEYKVTYSGEKITLVEETDVASNETGVSGIVSADNVNCVKITNAMDGTEITISGTKALENPDGQEHSYSFILQQVESKEDLTPILGGMTQQQTVSIKDEDKSFEFRLVYPKGTVPGTYYYLITEKEVQQTLGMDSSQYVAVVILKEENDNLTADLENIYLYKDGTLTPVAKVKFINSIVRTLSIYKTVENIGTEQKFEFEVTASLNGTPLEGTFICTGLEETKTLTFVKGKATVYLKDKESITIQGLPYGISYTVTEKNADGYLTKYQVGETAPMQYGASGGGTLTTDTTVSFLNSPGIELPATGTYLRSVYILGGWVLIFASLIGGIVIRYRKKRKMK